MSARVRLLPYGQAYQPHPHPLSSARILSEPLLFSLVGGALYSHGTLVLWSRLMLPGYSLAVGFFQHPLLHPVVSSVGVCRHAVVPMYWVLSSGTEATQYIALSVQVVSTPPRSLPWSRRRLVVLRVPLRCFLKERFSRSSSTDLEKPYGVEGAGDGVETSLRRLSVVTPRHVPMYWVMRSDAPCTIRR